MNVDPLPEVIVDSKEGAQMLIGSAATWHVMDTGDNPYKALMKLNDSYNKNNLLELRQQVVGITAQGLSVVMQGLPRTAMSNFREIDSNVKDACCTQLEDYGVNLVHMQFKAPHETNVSGQASIRAAEIQAAATRELGASNIQAAHILADAIRESSQYQSAAAAFSTLLARGGQLAAETGQELDNPQGLSDPSLHIA